MKQKLKELNVELARAEYNRDWILMGQIEEMIIHVKQQGEN